MSDLQEITRFCPTGNRFYVDVSDAKKLLDEIERLRATVAEQQSDIGWLRNRIAELHAATAAEGEGE